MPKRGESPAEESVPKHKRRTASVYDFVAGNVGLNGFLTAEKKASGSAKPLSAEEALLRHADSTNTFTQLHEAGQDHDEPDTSLPDSDLLKAVHAYAADFYSNATLDRGKHDSRSMDGSALIAIGCLLEEASRQLLGENGDMVLVEPRSRHNGLPETQLTRHQVIGKVRPPPTPEMVSEASSTDDEGVPAKKRRV
jgi:hypothetical protein